MKKQIFSKWPNYTFEELKAVKNVLLSGKVNYLFGEKGKKFEKAFSTFIKSKYAVALSNGTIALEMALKAVGVGKNDEVIVTSRSYFATVSAIIRVGAKPVFIDVEIHTQNISLEFIKKEITKKTKAIICVHLAGYPCDMIQISKFAKKNKIFLIEDCAQAHGAKIKNRFVGTFGDIGAWSFCNDKIISTGGEGGMITTNNKLFYQYVWSYKDHGKNPRKYFKKYKKKLFRYTHDTIGSNYRMTEMQSAIGLYQVNKLEKWIKIRNNYAKKVSEVISKFKSVIILNKNSDYRHAYYRFYFIVNNNFLKKKWSRNKIVKTLNDYNVDCGSGSCPEIYKEEAIKNLGIKPKKILKNSIYLGKNSIALNLHHNLNFKEVLIICNLLNKTLKMASK